MTKSTRLIAGLAVAGLLTVLSAIAWGAVTYADEVLNPPARLEYQTPYTDQFGCTECVRGPYVLNTDAQGNTPADLSKLIVELESAIDEDVDLIITTEYGVSDDGNLTAPDSAYVCVSDSFGGRETCTFTSESKLQEIRGHPIYIFVINLGPEGHEFTLTADWEPSPLPSDSYQLKSNEPQTTSIKASSFTDTQGKRFFTFEVPDGTALWALRVRAANPQANVDAYVGRSLPRGGESPRDKALFALTSALGEEFLILFQPQAGRYWIAVENLTNEEQTVEVITLAVFDIQSLLSGQSAQGQVSATGGLLPYVQRYLQTQVGFLSFSQYRFALAAQQIRAAQGLRITLHNRSGSELRLHLRYDHPVEISGGWVISDLMIDIQGGSEIGLVLAGQLLRPGALFFAIEAIDSTQQPQQFELRVELLQAGGQVQVLQAEEEQPENVK